MTALAGIYLSIISYVNLPPADPLGYPVPAWILLDLSFLTLTLHLLAMNFTIGGAAILLFTLVRKNPDYRGIRHFFGSGLPLGVSYIITLGIPPLLFVQVLYGQLFYSSSILVGSFWIQVIPALIIAYSGFYYHKFKRQERPRWQWPITIVSLIFLLYIGYIYVNNFTLSMMPEKWLPIYAANPAGGVLHHGEPTVIPRLLLFLSGAFAVAGMSLIWRGTFLLRWGYQDEGRRSHSFGFKAFLLTPIIWFIAAGGIYAARPEDVAMMFASGNTTTTLLITGIISGLVAGIFAFVSLNKKKLIYPLLASWGILGAMASMVIFRDLVRQAVLSPYFKISSIPVNAQWGMFAIFMVSLVIGLALLIVLSVKVIPRMAEMARERFDSKI